MIRFCIEFGGKEKPCPNPKFALLFAFVVGGRAVSSWPLGLLSILQSFVHRPLASHTEFLCKLSFYMAIVSFCVESFHPHYHNTVGSSLHHYLASASLSFKLRCSKSEHSACCCRRVVLTVDLSVVRFSCLHRHFYYVSFVLCECF